MTETLKSAKTFEEVEAAESKADSRVINLICGTSAEAKEEKQKNEKRTILKKVKRETKIRRK